MPFKNPISVITGSLQAGDPAAAHTIIDANGLFVYRTAGTLMFEVTPAGGVRAYANTGNEVFSISATGVIRVTSVEPTTPAGAIQFSDAGAPTTLRNFTSKILDGRHIKTFHADASATQSWAGGAAEADVTGATVTFSVSDANAEYIAWAHWQVDTTVAPGNASLALRCAVDGSTLTPAGAAVIPAAEVGRTYAMEFAGSLGAAGSHTIKLRCSRAAGVGTYRTIATNTGLTVLVVDRI